MFKKFASIIFILSLVLSTNIPVYAIEPTDESVNNSFEEVVTIADSIDEMIVNDINTCADGMAQVGVSVARSGNTEDVKVFLKYSGPFLSNAIRYKQITVKNRSDLVGTIYDVFGNGTTYYTIMASTAGYLYYVEVGTASVPTDLEQVKVVCNGVQVYCMSDHQDWHALNPGTHILNIN